MVMTKREQIEQAIISASAFTGNDTEELLQEVDKVYKKAKAFDDIDNADELYYEEHGEYPPFEEFLSEKINEIVFKCLNDLGELEDEE